jgi:hypothetical protein
MKRFYGCLVALASAGSECGVFAAASRLGTSSTSSLMPAPGTPGNWEGTEGPPRVYRRVLGHPGASFLPGFGLKSGYFHVAPLSKALLFFFRIRVHFGMREPRLNVVIINQQLHKVFQTYPRGRKVDSTNPQFQLGIADIRSDVDVKVGKFYRPNCGMPVISDATVR